MDPIKLRVGRPITPEQFEELSDEQLARLVPKAYREFFPGKDFCAGGDISGMQRRMNAPAGEIAFNGWHRQQRVHHAQALLHTMPNPVIAAVNGAASGLGADTALACDFIVASEWASFTWSYINRGLIPDGGGMYFLPRRVGLPKAKELIFTGRQVKADEALALGAFGVPTIEVDGKLFWGLDALPMLRDYLDGGAWFQGPDWDAAPQVPVGIRRQG